MKKESKGLCILAGAGPGDIGLVTLRAREALEQAQVVVYDYLCNPEILKWAPADAEIVFAGKKSGQHTLRQEEINQILVDKTREGKRVVRLKGGDPFVFGRGGEEAEALAGSGSGIRNRTRNKLCHRSPCLRRNTSDSSGFRLFVHGFHRPRGSGQRSRPRLTTRRWSQERGLWSC